MFAKIHVFAKKNVGNTRKIIFAPLSKVRLYLIDFSRDSQLFHGFMWIGPVMPFTQTGQGVRKVLAEI
jgi:hypothetical protein